MQLGVDFGTTRTIVSYVDRGNYPVVSFTDALGDTHDHFPSVAALRDGELVFGFAALAAAESGAPVVRSFKRMLAAPDVNAHTPIHFGDRALALGFVLTGFLQALLEALRTDSSISGDLASQIEPQAVVAVPAHAHGAQRFLTLDAFRRSGFVVLGVLNEPSAAGFEYTHRQARTLSSRRTRVIVFDLGGGTFDASLVAVDDKRHEVLDSLGLNDLGGDDFDLALAECAADAAQVDLAELSAQDRAALLDECRDAKERLTPQSKRIALEVAGTPVTVQVADFYDRATPLVERAIDAMAPLVGGLDDADDALAEVAGIYLVGGASSLPLVPRVLRERFGRRVHRSPYPAASTAIGLAIAADESSGFSLSDRLSRGFGVFRESAEGEQVDFDPIFDRTTALGPGAVVEREYDAAHNVGWYRFVEYSRMDADGQPRGELTPYGEVIFPFDPALQQTAELASLTVARREGGPRIRETYRVDEQGLVSATILDLSTGHRIEIMLTGASWPTPTNQRETR
ncbi:Hsp70 family protein [Blastococcus sp. Marseille-P5729]|uniref:Hsp70 family protein n=1 Tax=Blastococcus sp. Marseille-P5729 TaxID=2086582 RepID=UPI000D0FFF02|nr:Hsp70 family protein [Blastococcus sp. Marseille-P5729]